MPTVTAPNRPWLPQEIADLADEQGVDLTPFDNPKKGTIAYWIRAACQAGVGLADMLEAIEVIEPQTGVENFAPWDAVADAAGSVVDAASDVVGDIGETAGDLWEGSSKVVTDVYGFGRAVAGAAGEAGAAMTDALSVLDNLGDWLVPDGEVPHGDFLTCLPRAIGRSVGPAMVGGLVGLAIPGLTVGAGAGIAGVINAGKELAECTMARQPLEDKVFVQAHDRNGRPVASYFRSPPSDGETITASLSVPAEATMIVTSHGDTFAVNEEEPDMDTQVFGEHATEAPPHMLTGVRFPALVRLDERTDDGRKIFSEGFGVRDLPLSFSMMDTTQHGAEGTAPIVGSLDEVTVEDGVVSGRGWLLDEPAARRSGRLIQSGALRGNSVELAASKVEMAWDEDSEDLLIDFVEAKLAATTLVAVPAMEGCTVELEDPDFDFGPAAEDAEAVLASAGSFTNHQPSVSFSLALPEADRDLPAADLFAHVEVDEPHPLHVSEDGAVYGYLALWDSKHLDAHVRPPRSHTNYAYFANKEVLTTDGFVATGQLVIGGEHASHGLGWQDTVDFYAATSEAWADVAIGEDEHGIWVAGMVRPGTSEEVVHAGRASALSGDWRRIGNSLELVAALSVNTPAFPIPRAFAAQGRELTLTGAGVLKPEPRKGMFQTITADFDPDVRADLAAVARAARREEAKLVAAGLLERRSDQRRTDARRLVEGL